MCIFPKAPTPETPVLPPEPAQAKAPDNATASKAGEREEDRLRARASTVLTSGSGVTAAAPTAKKTLLGQ